MTERLSSLLHDEANTVDIPAPRAAEVLPKGTGSGAASG